MGFMKKVAPYALGGVVGGTAIAKGGAKSLVSPIGAALQKKKKDRPNSLIGQQEQESLMEKRI